MVVEVAVGTGGEPAQANARSAMSTSELAWFKSSYSSGSEGDCVEVAIDWFKSSYSSDCDCVEVALTPATVHVRDSKDKAGPRLALSAAAWGGFFRSVAGARGA
jgi:hypothetical protein